MDLGSEILREHSRKQSDRIARWVGSDPRRFRELIMLLLSGGPGVAERAAWIVRICTERHPEMVRPYLRRLVARIRQRGAHDAVVRNIVGMLQSVDIPDELLGRVASVCFDILDGESPVAAKAFSMTVLGRIAEREPDLARELRLVVERQLPYASAGFRARARKVLGLRQSTTWDEVAGDRPKMV